jgi:hypothetical protein
MSTPRNINAWIGAPLAAPVALLVGSAIWYLSAFGTEGLAVRLLWQSVMCFWVLLGSLLLSPVVFYALDHLRVRRPSKTVLLLAALLGAGFFAALFLAGQVTTSMPWLVAATIVGLATNGLVFMWAHIEP